MAVFPAGHILTSADFDTLFPTGVGAATGFTPTWTQGATITKNTTLCEYMKIGRMVYGTMHLNATSAGTAATQILVTGLPVAAAAAYGNNFVACGSGYFQDASTGNVYAIEAAFASTTSFFFRSGTSTANFGATGGTFALAIASGDNLTFHFRYMAAS